MIARFHRLVQKDVWDVMQHYQQVAGDKLADEFYDEFIRATQIAAENPERFHFDRSGLRRSNLPRFPYHILYRVRRDDILILVLRHHHRHPSFGLKRDR
jgi:plasmid stabilization system protein ParE